MSSQNRPVYASDHKVWNAFLENDHAYLRVIRMSTIHRCECQEEVLLASGESAAHGKAQGREGVTDAHMVACQGQLNAATSEPRCSDTGSDE